MAGHDGAGQVQACALRVSRLEPNGVPDPGSNNRYTTDALVRLGIDFDIRAGEELSQVNGSGEECVYYKSDDKYRKLNLTLEICTPDPELIELLAGGTVAYELTDAIGYSLPKISDAAPRDVGIEAWSRAVIDGTQASSRPWWRTILPLTRNWKFAGFAVENGVRTVVLNGHGYQNSNFFDGPLNDIPSSVDTEAMYSQFRDDDVPATHLGYQSISAS